MHHGPGTTTPTRGVKPLRLVAVGLQVVLLGALAVGYSMVMDITAAEIERFDYFTLHASARQADRGLDPYGPVYVLHAAPDGPVLGVRHANLNAPLFVTAMRPLSRLPADQGYRIFTAVTLLLALLAVPFLVAAMPANTPRARAAVDVILILAISFPVFLSVRLGQVGHALLLPVAIAWWALRTGRDRWAGCALGVALAFKVFFGLFLIMLLVARRWRAAATMVLVSGAVSLLGALPLGLHAFGAYAQTLSSVDWYSSPWNASLMGALMRVFIWSEVADHPMLAVVGGTVWALIVGVLLSGAFGTVRRLSSSPSPDDWDGMFGVTLATMLVISPLAWVYYLPLLIIPLIVAMRCRDRTVKVLVGIGWLLCAVPFNQAKLTDLSTVEIFTVQGGFASWGLLAAAAGMLVVARRSTSRSIMERPMPASASLMWRSMGSGSLPHGSS